MGQKASNPKVFVLPVPRQASKDYTVAYGLRNGSANLHFRKF